MTAQTAIPFNIQDPYWSETHPGMPCRIKHRLILVRHGESESNVELTTTGQTTEHTSIPLEVGVITDGQKTALNVVSVISLYNSDRKRNCQKGLNPSPLY